MARWLLITVTAVLMVCTGCSANIPSDPNGTLERLTHGTIKVGVSHQPPWADVTEDRAPTGIEVELVRDFADSIEADVEWVVGGEEHLIALLERAELDLVIGGITDSSPWGSQAALTTVYTEALGPDGKPQGHVMAVPLGENAFMVAVERFLLSQDVEL